MVYTAYYVKSGLDLERIGDFPSFEETEREVLVKFPSARLGNLDHRYGGQVFYVGSRVTVVVRAHRGSGIGPVFDRVADFEIKRLDCKRCGHTWHPRTGYLPKVCPKCKSPYWDEERKKDIEAERERKRELKRMPMSERIIRATAEAQREASVRTAAADDDSDRDLDEGSA